MRKYLLTLLVLMIVIMISLSIWLNNDDDNEYFSETYDKIYYSFNITHNTSNVSSYVIIPAPFQNGKTLEFSDFQNNKEFNNYSYEYIDTDYGEGIKISPIPTNNFWIWFECDSYTVQAPFDIKQTDQFYRSDYPGLSTWETDGESAYYWFYSSENITEISYKFEDSDCYAISDMGEVDNIGKSGWIKTKYMRVQEEMPM